MAADFPRILFYHPLDMSQRSAAKRDPDMFGWLLSASLGSLARQPGCVSQDRWSMALKMRPLCSYLESLVQNALRIVQARI